MSTLAIPAAFIAALIAVESGGNDHAIDGDNGRAVGCLQIHPAVVEDVNRIGIPSYLPGKKFFPEDRFSRLSSTRICRIYLAHYATKDRLGREPSLEDLARIWNGRPDGYKKDGTKPYWVKVRTAMEDGVTADSGNFYTSVMGFYCFAAPEGDFLVNQP